MLNAEAKRTKFSNIITNHVMSNIKAYVVTVLIFIVGIFLGVMFVNNIQETQKYEISSYINTYVKDIKESGQISTVKSLKNNIKDNIVLAICLWFAGTTLIGIPIVFGIIFFRGFGLGYTISACTYTMGFGKGLAFILIALVMQNILFVPAMIAIGVSGIKLYKSIIKDRRRETIKLEILKHTVFSTIMLVVLIISALIKINISGRILENLIKYF